MKKITSIFITVVILFGLTGCGSSVVTKNDKSSLISKNSSKSSSSVIQKKHDPSVIKIYFIGNSLTYAGDIPEQLAVIANSKHRKLVYYSNCVSNCTLELHYGQMNKHVLSRGDFDYVVLQEHGSPPLEEPEKFEKYVSLFDQQIKKSSAKTILYITSRTGDENGVATNERQYPLTLAYERAAKMIGAILAPCGPCWVNCNKINSKIKFYQEDHLHPTLIGGYINACVFYSILYHESPVGADYSYIKDELKAYGKDSDKIARLLQETAWNTVKNFKPDNLYY